MLRKKYTKKKKKKSTFTDGMYFAFGSNIQQTIA